MLRWVCLVMLAACARSPEVRPTAVAAAPADDAARNPCFPARGRLPAAMVRAELQDYSHDVVLHGRDGAPAARYGACTVEGGMLRDREGRLLAELHCGTHVFARGFTDDFGHEVGVDGARVAAGYAGRSIVCTHGGEGRTRCSIGGADENDYEAAHYYLAGAPPADVVTGDDAVRLLSSGPVLEFMVNGWCH